MDAAFEVLLSSLSEAEPNNDRAPTLLRRREEDRDMCFPSGGPSAPGRRLSSRPQGQGGARNCKGLLRKKVDFGMCVGG